MTEDHCSISDNSAVTGLIDFINASMQQVLSAFASMAKSVSDIVLDHFGKTAGFAILQTLL
jgi:hypothetical protein